MNLLEKEIINKIKKEGPITFEAFMELALYYPELGYYSSYKIVLGKKGDFYTSPHLHPSFGAVIGKQLIEMWHSQGRPDEFNAVEIGAGHGYLCHDILDYLTRPSKDPVVDQNKTEFLATLQYVIVEPFLHFENRQKETLNSLLSKPYSQTFFKHGIEEKIRWIHSVTRLKNITGCIFSNELPDAFPVHIIEMGNELEEVFVDFNGTNFIEEKRPLHNENIKKYLDKFSIVLNTGYRTEVNLRIKSWLYDIASVMAKGFLLTIDYGYSAKEYYSEDRSKGTLLCYDNHQYNENPYQNIGRQDLTAHINFSSLKEWGEESGLRTIGYCPQGAYLIAAGIDEIISELYSDSPDYLSEMSKIKGLILPQGMGESHSVMIQYKGDKLPELRGFSMRNLAGSL